MASGSTTPQVEAESKPPAPGSETYPAGCHCGYIKFDVTLSPPLAEQKILECNCSICRRMGYLLVCACTSRKHHFLSPMIYGVDRC